HGREKGAAAQQDGGAIPHAAHFHPASGLLPSSASASPSGSRMATPSLAERARGLAAISTVDGRRTPRPAQANAGGGTASGGRCRERAGGLPPASSMKRLTRRSSPEWKVTITRRPPGRNTSWAAASRRSS